MEKSKKINKEWQSMFFAYDITENYESDNENNTNNGKSSNNDSDDDDSINNNVYISSSPKLYYATPWTQLILCDYDNNFNYEKIHDIRQSENSKR